MAKQIPISDDEYYPPVVVRDDFDKGGPRVTIRRRKHTAESLKERNENIRIVLNNIMLRLSGGTIGVDTLYDPLYEELLAQETDEAAKKAI